MMRFHQLDIDELREVGVQLMVYAEFGGLPNDSTLYEMRFEDVPLEVEVRRLDVVPKAAMFEFGGGQRSGYTIPLRRTLISFRLTGGE